MFSDCTRITETGSRIFLSHILSNKINDCYRHFYRRLCRISRVTHFPFREWDCSWCEVLYVTVACFSGYKYLAEHISFSLN